MIDLLDLLHYLIGIIIVGLILWTLIQIHNYFSKDNIPIMPSTASQLTNPNLTQTPPLIKK